MEGRRLGVALLAAGASHRFGDEDKLAADFRGKPLAEYAANALPVAAFESAWVVVSGPGHPCEKAWAKRGLRSLVNLHSSQGMGTSLALAAQAAVDASLDGLLIALADMPLVPTEHFSALIEACKRSQDIAVSAQNDIRMPPAVFGSDHFAELVKASGDRGARGLIQLGQVIDCPPEWLKDVDRIEDL